MELRMQRAVDGEPELEQDQGRDQPADEHICPGHEEPHGRVDPPGGVGGQRTRRGHLPGEQADRPCAEQARDEGEHHGERQGAAREGDPGGDGRGDGRAGCHVGDALEQDLAQADRVPPQSHAGVCPRRCRHSRLLGRSQTITAGMFSRQARERARPRTQRNAAICALLAQWRAMGQPELWWPFVLKPCRPGKETSAVTSAASRTRSPSPRRTSVPGSTRSSLT